MILNGNRLIGKFLHADEQTVFLMGRKGPVNVLNPGTGSQGGPIADQGLFDAVEKKLRLS